MPWQSVSVRVSRELADAGGDAFLELGAISVNVDDALEGTSEEKPIFGEPGADSGLWNQCRLTALFAADADISLILTSMAKHVEAPQSAFEIEQVEDEDWVQRNRDQFQPIKISDRIWIVPTWHRAPQDSAINISLDPGIAFGTGSHPTTRMCLQWLEKNLEPGAKPTVLDYGSGSGILAIAAMKLGAARAYGVDIDPAAVEAAKYNAAQNNVAAHFADGESVLDIVADVLVANILANPLRMLAPLFAAQTKPGGALILAGILDPQAEEIISIYREWFDLRVWKSDEGWACVAGQRRSAR
ncbi:MAG: 50S ribosomal protein L11 methyltransferase [Usitatibacteraceae bacterium]